MTCFAVVKEFSAYIQLVCFNEVDIRVQNILNECDCNVLVFSIPASYVVYEVYVCVCVCVCVCTYLFIYEVACWRLVSKFAGSNPAEAVGFLMAKKSSARLPSEGK